MRYTADKLEALDEYFEQKSEGEKWLMIILFAAAVGFLAYSYLFPLAKDLFDQSVVEKKAVQKKVNQEKGYLKSITVNGDRNFYVKKFDAEIVSKKGSIQSYKKRIAVINSNLDKLSDLLFNQKSWSLFLDSITERADANSIVIEKLSNKYVKSHGNFGHVLEIGLKCGGNFKNILQFINDIEQNVLVTDIYSSKIHTDANRSMVLADINISVWGVNH